MDPVRKVKWTSCSRRGLCNLSLDFGDVLGCGG